MKGDWGQAFSLSIAGNILQGYVISGGAKTGLQLPSEWTEGGRFQEREPQAESHNQGNVPDQK